MNRVFFTADMHFGYENVIGFDGRPFASADEMDSELIKRWNNNVGCMHWNYEPVTLDEILKIASQKEWQ